MVAAQVAVELQNATSGAAIPGFGLADANQIKGATTGRPLLRP
jgi:hypothetical protein